MNKLYCTSVFPGVVNCMLLHGAKRPAKKSVLEPSEGAEPTGMVTGQHRQLRNRHHVMINVVIRFLLHHTQFISVYKIKFGRCI